LNILAKILEDVKVDVKMRSQVKPIDPAHVNQAPKHSLVEAIERAPHIPLIAEVKRSSPSAGKINPGADPVVVAQAMLNGGAVSLSVLTESKHFDGDPSFLREIRKITDAPLLYKGFIIDDYQIYEAAELRADAVLLITKVLKDELSGFMELATKFGMESLVEVTNEQEVKIAESAGANLIGVNNRDLETLSVDLSRTVKLAPLISEDVTVVSESGISSPIDVLRMLDAGADAILVGTAIMKEKDIEGKVRTLVKARRYLEGKDLWFH